MRSSKHYPLPVGWKLKPPAAVGFDHGTPAQADNKALLEWADEGHALTIAPTGQGKGRSVLLPLLLSWPGSAVVLDVKGENAAVSARYRARLGPIVRLDPFHLTTDTPDCFNPLDLALRRPGHEIELALMLTHLLRGELLALASDPFWDNRADALISGLVAHLLSRPEKGSFLDLRRFLANDNVDYNLALLLDNHGAKMNRFAYEEIAQYLQINEDKTRPGVLATAQTRIHLLGDPAVEQALSSTSFDLEAFLRGDPVMTLYLVIPPGRLRSHALMLRLWMASLMHLLSERRRRPPQPTLFLVDEAAQLGPMEPLRTAITLLRGYGVKTWTFWQDLSQLKRLYPLDWETMINNTGLFQTFGVSTWLMARELSQVMGTVSPEGLLSLAPQEQFLAFAGSRTIRAGKLDYLKDAMFQGKYAPNPFFEAAPAPPCRSPRPRNRRDP
jgi:type IV secretion system protein VirD4